METVVADPNKEELKKRRGRKPKAQVPSDTCAGCGQPASRVVAYQDGPIFNLCENDDCHKTAMDKWQAEQQEAAATQATADATFNGAAELHNGHLQGEIIPHMTELPSMPLGPYGSLTGLTLPEELTYEEWASIGKNQLRTMAESSMWWLGDFLAFGDKKYGQTWAQIAEDLGYAEQTVKNAKKVAELIPPEMRIAPPHDGKPGLTWSHHQEVSFMGRKGIKKWLQLALDNQWTKMELRDALREAKAGTNKETAPGQSQKGKKDKPPTAAEATEGLMNFGRGMWDLSPDVALLNDWLGRLHLLIESEQWDWDTFDGVFSAMTRLRDRIAVQLREAVDVQKFRDVELSAVEQEEEEETEEE